MFLIVEKPVERIQRYLYIYSAYSKAKLHGHAHISNSSAFQRINICHFYQHTHKYLPIDLCRHVRAYISKYINIYICDA